jgi:hypothetical protein
MGQSLGSWTARLRCEHVTYLPTVTFGWRLVVREPNEVAKGVEQEESVCLDCEER